MSDYSNNVFTTGVINASIDGYMYGELEFSGDEDWFKILLRKNMSYTINLEGMATNQGSLSDPYLRGIYDSNGYFIDGTKDDDSGLGTNSKVIFSPAHTDYYYISAGAYKSDIGIYKLTVTTNNEVDYSKLDSVDGISFYDAGNTYNIASYFDLKNKSLITGHVSSNSDSYDFYQFYARENRKVSIKLTGLSSDIDLELSDIYGNGLAYSGAGGNSDEYISYEIKAGNTYNIAVKTYGNSVSNYNLSIETTPLPKVYWSVRDLAPTLAFVGNHHFLQFENVGSDYNTYNFGNERNIFTLGTTMINGRLSPYESDIGDINAINESVYGTSSWYDYDLENHILTPPNGMNNDEMVNRLIQAYENYIVNENKYPIKFDLNSTEWFDSGSPYGNCATWVNSILAYVGFSESDRERLGDFSGVDWGEENLLDMRYFQQDPFWG